MVNRAVCLFIIVVVLVGGLVSAQDTESESLAVYAGAVVYSDPVNDSLALVEFPYSLSRHEFEFFRPAPEEDSSLYARVFAQVDLIDPRGIIADSVSTYFSVRVDTRLQAYKHGIRLFNKLQMLVRPGVYSARVTVIDVVSKRSGEAFIEKVVVEPPATGGITIGGPAVAYSINRVDEIPNENARLVRNGFLVIPNPVGIFSLEDTAVYLYVEMYSPGIDTLNPPTIRLSFDVLHIDGRPFRQLGHRDIQPDGERVAMAEIIDIKGWPAGQYDIHVIAEDTGCHQADTNQVAIAIVSPTAIIAVAKKSQTDDPYNDLLLNEKVQLVYYRLTLQQRETLKGLSPTGKATFLAQYWKEQADNVGPEIRRERTDLIERYRYANQHYSTNEQRDNGWATDRGRIVLTYGRWEEIEQQQMPRLRNPFEIWYYHTLKEGKVFVFEEWQPGEYRLVHSTVYGEVFSKEWDDIIKGGMIDISPGETPMMDDL